MTAPKDCATGASTPAHANGPLPLRAANLLGDTLDALDTLGRRYDEGPRASASVRKQDGRPARLVAKRGRRKRERHAKTRVAFFRYSYYDIAFRFFVEHVLNAEFVCLPEANRQTLERGAAQSNDFVCAPLSTSSATTWKPSMPARTCWSSSRGLAASAITESFRNPSCAIWATSSRCSISPP